MRKLIARVFDYSLDGLIATEGTEFFQFCRDLPDDPAEDACGIEFYAGADLRMAIMRRRCCLPAHRPAVLPDGDREQRRPVNAAHKVVFSSHAQDRRPGQCHHCLRALPGYNSAAFGDDLPRPTTEANWP